MRKLFNAIYVVFPVILISLKFDKNSWVFMLGCWFGIIASIIYDAITDIQKV